LSDMRNVISRLDELVGRDNEFSPLRDAVVGIYGENPSLDGCDYFMSHAMFCVHRNARDYSPRIELQQLPADRNVFIVRLIRVVDERDGILFKEIEELTGASRVVLSMFSYLYSKFLEESV
jgi:hypothetical protein